MSFDAAYALVKPNHAFFAGKYINGTILTQVWGPYSARIPLSPDNVTIGVSFLTRSQKTIWSFTDVSSNGNNKDACRYLRSSTGNTWGTHFHVSVHSGPLRSLSYMIFSRITQPKLLVLRPTSCFQVPSLLECVGIAWQTKHIVKNEHRLWTTTT